MTDLARALWDFAQLFERLGTPYAVMGGIAVRVYGIPRPTYDVDFTLAIDRNRLPELFEAVRALGYSVPEAYETGWVDRVGGMPLVKVRLYLEGRGVDIDLFLAESRFQEQLLARRRREQLEEAPVWLVSPEDLILLKLLARRPRDLADIGDILFTQGQLDEAYLRSWAEQLGVLPELERVLTEPPIV
jgi:hypothetical protein